MTNPKLLILLLLCCPTAFSTLNNCVPLLQQAGQISSAYAIELKAVRKAIRNLKGEIRKLKTKQEPTGPENVQQTLKRMWEGSGLEVKQNDLRTAEQREKELLQAASKLVVVRAPKNQQEWTSLSYQQQTDYLKEIFPFNEKTGDLDGIHLVVTELSDWKGNAKSDYAKKILWSAKAHVGKIPEADELQATVGNPEATIYVYQLKDGSTIGGLVHLHQEGAFNENADGRGTHFNTWKAATAAGYHSYDISWEADVLFDTEGRQIEGKYPDLWEWAGH